MRDPFACIVCGGVRFKPVFRKGPWRYDQCRGCRTVALHPRPDEARLLASYEDYLSPAPAAAAAWEAMTAPVVLRAAHLLKTRCAGRRLLDIGCGYGFFLKKMQDIGWQVQGVEVSAVGRHYARRRLGLRVKAGPLKTLEAPSDRFDAVTLFYVIEHLRDPLGLLRRVHALLRPAGIVMIRWPHSTPIVKLFGPLARHFDLYHTPYHLYDFNPESLAILLRKAGFAAVETFIGGHTLPAKAGYRLSSVFFGRAAEALCRLSGNRWLLPGVSKTTVAVKAGGFDNPGDKL